MRQVSVRVVLTQLHIELQEIFAALASRRLVSSHIVGGRPLFQGRFLPLSHIHGHVDLVTTFVKVFSLDLLQVALGSLVPIFQFLTYVWLGETVRVFHHLLELFLADQRAHHLELVLDPILLVGTRSAESHRRRATSAVTRNRIGALGLLLDDAHRSTAGAPMLLSSPNLLPLLKGRISDKILNALINNQISGRLHHALPRVAGLDLSLEALSVSFVLFVFVETNSWSGKMNLLQQLNVIFNLLRLFTFSILVVERTLGVHKLLRLLHS